MLLKFHKNIFFTFIGIFLLSSCEKFKRFGQEKYVCSENKFSLNQIDIIKSNSIKKAYMLVGNTEIQIKIQSMDKKEIFLSNDKYIIKINKKNNEVSISDDNKIHFLKCRSETFNM
ncbi:hypothetical protein OA264_00930 [Alphaproteobacteria bacterium]|nr:hypothetical protein [Alphaproteobacteria bacterium]